MRYKLWKKVIVFTIIISFIGASVVPIIIGENLSNYNLEIVNEKRSLTNDFSYFDIFRGITYVNITPASKTVEKGETFTIGVYISPGEPMIGIELDISFNATLLQANSVSEGDLFDGYTSLFDGGDIDNENGEITGVYGLVVGDNVSDPGYFCNISFTAQDIAGISNIEFYGVIVTDQNADPIPSEDLEVNDGSVTIEENSPSSISNPNPENGETDVSVDLTQLSVTINDPEGDTFDWSIETSPDIGTSSGSDENNGTKTCGVDDLEFNTTYTWYVNATDSGSGDTTTKVYEFTTEINNPPYEPSDPDPYNGETDVSIDTDLSWTGGDPDGDTVYYNVYLEAGDPTPDILVSENQTETTYTPEESLEYETQYFWQIIAWDEYGASTPGDVWDFTTSQFNNTPPCEPSDPDPYNGETDVSIDTDLSWTGGDPDGDTVYYNVYLEAGDPTPDILVSENQTETAYTPEESLKYETQYFWQIIAWDEYGASTPGDVWDFATKSPILEPDLSCSGNLQWVDVPPGDDRTGSFTIKNIGDPESLLDWEIVDYPDWGSSWNFTPKSGLDLTPEDGQVTVEVKVTAPNDKNTQFTGSIKIQNLEIPSDSCTIHVSLTTPKNKSSYYFRSIIYYLIERFPSAFPILKLMIKL